MIIIKNLNHFNIYNLIYFDKIKNNMIENGFFIKIIYSTQFFTLNSVYINIPFITLSYDNICNSKHKYNINVEINKNTINKIKTIEYDILKKVNLDKILEHKIYDKIKTGLINFYSNSIIDKNYNVNCAIVLKISGIWINDNSCGLSYKFIITNHLSSSL